MYKSLFNLRNFKKGLRLVEIIAKQNDQRAIDYACGYAIASIKAMKKAGKITKNQEKALIDLAYDTADDTTAEIYEDERRRITELQILDFDEIQA